MEKTKRHRCPKGMRKNKQGECVNTKETVVSVQPPINTTFETLFGEPTHEQYKPVSVKLKRAKCPNGTRKNKQGECVSIKEPSPLKSPPPIKSPTPIKSPSPIKNKTKKTRCPKGMRKNKQGVCIDTNPTIFAKIPEEPTKILPSSTIKLDTLEQQCDYYNSLQNKFIFKARNNEISIYNKETGTACGKIEIEKRDEIYIDLIGKCGSISGTEIIKVIEDFAQKCKYRKLALEDDSRLGTKVQKPEGGFCEFFLAGLSILTTGETWYNRLGYKSDYYDKEVKHNKRIIAKPFMSFMNKDIRKYLEDAGWPHGYLVKFDNMMKDCTTIVSQSELDKMTVKDFFTIVQKRMRNKSIDCKDAESLLFVRLLNYIQNNGGFVTNGWEKRKPNNIVILRLDENGNRVLQYKYLN